MKNKDAFECEILRSKPGDERKLEDILLYFSACSSVVCGFMLATNNPQNRGKKHKEQN